MDFQLVLQFNGSVLEDFDELIELEANLEEALGHNHVVDGHEFGSGEMNIFIYTNDPEEAFSLSEFSLRKTKFQNYVAAYRSFREEKYTVIHPKDYSCEFQVT